MKKVNFWVLLCSTVCMAFAMSSCNNEIHQYAYRVGIQKWQSSSFSDQIVVEDYIRSKGLTNESIIVTAATQDAADEEAKKQFDAQSAKLSVDEVAALGLHESTSFVYCVSRLVDATNPGSDVLIISSWAYPPAQ